MFCDSELNIIFYRIENESGLGVYDAGIGGIAASYTNVSDDYQSAPSHVFPEFNHENPNLKDYFFGFPSIADIYSWFNTFESIAYIKSRNGVIRVYEIDDKYVSIFNNQLIFIKDHAKKIDEIDFDYNKTTEYEPDNKYDVRPPSRAFMSFLQNELSSFNSSLIEKTIKERSSILLY